MKKRMLTVFMVCMLVTGSALAISDVCTIGYCGVATSSGLWVQLTGSEFVPAGTWAMCSSSDATIVNRMLAVFLVAKCMGSPIWVSGALVGSGPGAIFSIDTVCLL